METFSPFDILNGRNAREGIPSRTLVIESSHGRKKGQTPDASTGVGKQLNLNHRREVLLMNDPRRLTSQSPLGKRSGLGSITDNGVGRLNRLPD